MQLTSFIGIIFLMTALAACNTADPPNDDFHATDNFNRTIKFTVSHVYQLSPPMDSLIEGATINVYDNYFDFVAEAYPSASRVSDSTGYAEINALDQDFYYIRVKHPAFPDIEDSVSTPANTTSFVEMVFY